MLRGKKAEYAPEMSAHDQSHTEHTAESVASLNQKQPARPGSERSQERDEKKLVAEHQLLEMKQENKDPQAYHGSVELYVEAEERVYPGEGKMTAEDVRAIMDDVQRMHAKSVEAKKADAKTESMLATIAGMRETAQNCMQCRS